ncbi:hypothetical protein B566_EDAN010442 [Ephemera danica]|nr:hypothetical protein B566_EDAN010442 [Ephemera danica]
MHSCSGPCITVERVETVESSMKSPSMSSRRRGEASDSGRRSKKNDMEMQKQQDSHRSDSWNIALLFFLYLLQGIPLGLTAAIPMILQNRGASYKQQAEFSFVYWPFSLKLLWAPVVDSCFSSWFGRRKTWLIPTQYLIGLFMLILSGNVNDLLGGGTDTDSGHPVHPNVGFLTFVFFCLNFLAATQDIAVDGWALTMLQRKNVGHASTCNSVGQTAGYFFGYVLFMALESADFCNNYLRSVPSPEGFITLSGFLWFWGLVFLVTTTLVALLKAEGPASKGGEEPDLDLWQSYVMLWDIIKLPSILKTMAVLLTCKIGFSACDAVTGLKLVEAGVPKEKLALIAVPLVPLQIILPLVISKYTAGPRPMDVYLKAFPYRLYFGLLAAFMVSVYSMFVAVMAFFAQVSDPAVGGTYMTLLNTLSNLGGNWPSTSALWLVDSLTWRTCSGGTLNATSCLGQNLKEACIAGGGECLTQIDGYYVESLVCVVFGFLWLRWGHRTIQRLQSHPESAWQVFNVYRRLS